MHTYWASIFILPGRVVNELETNMRGFLWCQGPMRKGKAKVSWKAVCVPKNEGGLGIRRIGEMNNALMATNAWSIIVKRESLWVAWIHTYRLKDRNFWDCRIPSTCAWSWRKILQLRPIIQPFVWAKIGNCKQVSAWFDNWSVVGPLNKILSYRTISNGGFNLTTKVKDIWDDGRWMLPLAWYNLFPVLNNIPQLMLGDQVEDKFFWKMNDKLNDFSTSTVWQSIRTYDVEVNWMKIIWFSQCIPKHAFLMWLKMRKKLLTQDKIMEWGAARRNNMNMMCCLLCYENIDSHDHLFFSCKFSAEVWHKVITYTDMVNVNPVWEDAINWLLARRSWKTANSIVDRLIIAAMAYNIWRERNNRLFRNCTRPPDLLVREIISNIRYKLMGLKFKNSSKVRRLLEKWGVHEDVILDCYWRVTAARIMDDLSGSGGSQQEARATPRATFEEIAARFNIIDNLSAQTEPRNVNKIDELIKNSVPIEAENLRSANRVSNWEGIKQATKRYAQKLDSNVAALAGNGNSQTSATTEPGVNGMKFSAAQENLKFSGMQVPLSFAKVVNNTTEKVKVNFRSLVSPVTHEGCDVVLSRESVRAVQEKLANTLYGYFLGDRVAYPVVEYFVKNQWKRFGLQKSMMNANGFFFFQFADEAGMLNVLKEGPWIIRSQPMFLHIWSPTSKLEKKDVKKLQVWVKIHDVPIAAYTEDGLSMIATAIGEPKMLDSYTSSMCTENWGRSSYARALVEISVENGFKDEIVIAVPELEGEGFCKVILSVEYEWSPLRCAHCKVFGHSDESCPRQPRRAPKEPVTGQNKQGGSNTRKQMKQPVVDKEGFMDVERKKAARKSGFPVNKQKQKFEYRPIGSKPIGGASTSGPTSSVKTHNPFDVLSDTGKNVGKNGEFQYDKQDSDDEEVIGSYNETNEFMTSGLPKAGASTSSTKFFNG
ncbi:putative transcription factor interactor and regulator CCHC(Zn) family [Helianthus anomalus]